MNINAERLAKRFKENRNHIGRSEVAKQLFDDLLEDVTLNLMQENEYFDHSEFLSAAGGYFS